MTLRLLSRRIKFEFFVVQGDQKSPEKTILLSIPLTLLVGLLTRETQNTSRELPVRLLDVARDNASTDVEPTLAPSQTSLGSPPDTVIICMSFLKPSDALL